MKNNLWLIWIGLLVLAGCDRPTPTAVETVHAPSPHPELAAIDTLMQTRPDSALTLLLNEPMDDPYYQLLLSEALYKNDYAQANRTELLAAMAYFDSINDAFLAARCHYMNGVGYYEMDSVVSACAEYLKALEIMENHFEEKELVGYKAKFMALNYTRLYRLFSDQYLHEQAIYFGKNSLPYYYKYNAEPWHIAWMLVQLGSCYDVMEQYDSTDYYYQLAAVTIDSTNHLLGRDIAAHQAYLSYEINGVYQTAMDSLFKLLSQSESQKEYTARCLTIGEIFFHEQLFDSAWIYLAIVFENTQSIYSKKQAAEWLAEICKTKGKTEETAEYAKFLVPFANKEENQSTVKSQLTELYSVFLQKNLDRQHQQTIKKEFKRILLTLVLVGCILMIMHIIINNRKKRKELPSNEKWNSFEHFLSESICQDIILSIQGKNIKRSAVPMDYPELILNEGQLQQLTLTINRYFDSYDRKLEQHGLNTNPVLVNLCHLYLLGMDEKQAAILLNRDYSSIKRYEKKLKTAFNTQNDMVTFMRNLLLNN